MINEFSRTELLIGNVALERLKDVKILVFGIGGVGSHCIEALARSGVGVLAMVDNDKVSLTNINRQSVAWQSTVGRMKTSVMRERLGDINPSLKIVTSEEFVLPDNLQRIMEGIEEEMGGRPDYIIDAIDTVSAKLAIAEYAVREDIPIISCMGTGNKLHPELFRIEDISKTKVCPLCRVMRRELKARGICHLTVLYSEEKPVDTSERATGEETGMRRSLPGSISFVPPVAGLLIAGEVVRRITGVT